MEITSFKHQRAALNLVRNRSDIPYVFLIGGYGCLNGEAEISTPTGPVPLYEFEGGPVNTPIGVRNASWPVPVPMHTVLVEGDDFQIHCNGDHLLACSEMLGVKFGSPLWIPVRHLMLLNLLWLFLYSTTEDISPLIQPSSVQHWMKTIEDYLFGYLACYHFDDELLRHLLEDAQYAPPLREYVQEHSIQFPSETEDVEIILECIHLYRLYNHVYKTHSTSLLDLPSFESLFRRDEGYLRQREHFYQDVLQSLHLTDLLDKVPSVQESTSLIRAYVYPPIYIIGENSHRNHVLKITPAGPDTVYRLHVDEAECYYANGILHHNCGKSYTDVQLLLMLTSAYMYSKTPLTIGIIGVTIKLLTQTVLKDFKAALDQASIPYKDNAMKGQLTIGSLTFIYLAMSNPGEIYAHNFCCALVDEMDELPAEKVLEVVKAVQERCRVRMPPPFDRDPFIFFSTTAQGMGGTYQLCEYFKKRGLKYAIVRGKTEYNTSLAKSQIDLLRKLYTEEEAKAYLDGEFVNLTTGRVYSEFNRKKHVCMRFPIQPTETIYVGQDYNCIEGDSLISTDRGLVRMKDIRIGMKVLTRKGYKKVLAHVEKGMQQCEQYNNLIATPDHKAITEGGQICLNQANTLLSIPLSALKRAAEVEKLLSLKTKDIIEDMITMSQRDRKSECSTLQYGKQNMEKYLKDILYTTSIIISWITGSKTLPVLLFKNIQIYIEKICSLQIPDLLSETRNEVLQKIRGIKEVCSHIKHVQDAERCFSLKLVLQDTAPSVEKLLGENYINLEKVLKTGGAGIVYALNAVALLRELYPLSIVLSTQSIGNVKRGKKGIRKVYDITVEDCPEFFADGILVHNCGFNASCEVVERAGRLVIINSHHWDYMGDAPRRLRQMYPTNPIVMIPDASGKEIMSGFRDEVEASNIQIIWNNKNASITERIMAVNKALAWGQLSVMEYNEFEKDSLQDKIIVALETRDFDDAGKPRKGKGPNALDHGADSMEYAIWHIIHSIHGYEKILTVLRATHHRRDNSNL